MFHVLSHLWLWMKSICPHLGHWGVIMRWGDGPWRDGEGIRYTPVCVHTHMRIYTHMHAYVLYHIILVYFLPSTFHWLIFPVFNLIWLLQRLQTFATKYPIVNINTAHSRNQPSLAGVPGGWAAGTCVWLHRPLGPRHCIQ